MVVKKTDAKNALLFDRLLIFGAKTCDRDSELVTMPGTQQRRNMNDTKTVSRTRQEELGQFLTATPVVDFMASQGLGSQRDIRCALIKAELADCIVALPGQIFYSAQISDTFQKAA